MYKEFQINDVKCIITKNAMNGWLAYIDITNWPEIHNIDNVIVNSILPFHGGCTFNCLTSYISNHKFDKPRYLLGCDWCHNYEFLNRNFPCVEDVPFKIVKLNLKEVVKCLPELILKMTIQGKNNVK